MDSQPALKKGHSFPVKRLINKKESETESFFMIFPYPLSSIQGDETNKGL